MSFVTNLKRLLAAIACASVLAFGFQPSAQAQCPKGMNISSNFGWIQNTPVTHVVFWPPERGDALSLLGHWKNLLNDPQFYSRVSEYKVKPGHFGQAFTITSSAPTGTLDDSTISYFLYLALLSAGHPPQSNENYLIALPKGSSGSGGALGHHDWANVQFPDGNTYTMVYSVVEYQDRWADMDLAMSHELFESYIDPIWVTDSNNHPVPLGWADDGNDWLIALGRELVDLCVEQTYPIPQLWTLQGTYLAKVWSQSLCSCQ